MGEHVKARADTMACHQRAVQRVIATMVERLDEELSLHDMADVAIMSPFHFNRTFHHVIGMPPGRFLSALRLDRARRLLLTTKERVTDVCFDVGYNSLGTFTRRFTEVLGISPRGLRSFTVGGTALPVAVDPAPAGVASMPESHLHGTVETPPGFTGVVLIGLFRSAVPYGVPAACSVLAGGGPFSLNAPSGRYHVYALGLRYPLRPLELLLFDEAPRASGGIIDIPLDAPTALRLALRPRQDLDPPILLALPLLFAKRQGDRLRQSSPRGRGVTDFPERLSVRAAARSGAEAP
jgi:AraC-like DNA-binding protein